MSDEDFQAWQKKAFIIVALVSVLGGNAGSVLNATRPEMRADAWTATQDEKAMRTLRNEIMARFVRNESYIDDAREDAHLALSNDNACQTNMKQIENKLDYHMRHDH